jgi:hypothetical protein
LEIFTFITELSIAATGSVRKDMEDMQVSLIRGHSHRIASHMVTYELRNSGEGETLRGYEIGHMCDEKGPGMKYTQHHDWQKGFAIAHIVNDYPTYSNDSCGSRLLMRC